MCSVMNISTDRISVVMPAYNSEAYIREALNGLIQQSYKNWELVAVDDGSSDSTGSILDEYASKDVRIKVFHTDNGGVSKARNYGIDHSNGDWIILMDSDDIYAENAFEKLINASKGFDLVISNYDRFSDEDHSGAIKSRITEETEYHGLESLAKDYKQLFHIGLFHSACNILIRREVLKARFREDICMWEDGLFILDEFRYVQDIKLIPNVTYHYRDGIEGSLSKSWLNFQPQMCREFEEAVNKVFDNVDINDMYYDAYINGIVSSIRQIYEHEGLSPSEKQDRVRNYLDNANVKIITARDHMISNENMHLWSVLMTKDMSLIEEAFKQDTN